MQTVYNSDRGACIYISDCGDYIYITDYKILLAYDNDTGWAVIQDSEEFDTIMDENFKDINETVGD